MMTLEALKRAREPFELKPLLTFRQLKVHTSGKPENDSLSDLIGPF